MEQIKMIYLDERFHGLSSFIDLDNDTDAVLGYLFADQTNPKEICISLEKFDIDDCVVCNPEFLYQHLIYEALKTYPSIETINSTFELDRLSIGISKKTIRGVANRIVKLRSNERIFFYKGNKPQDSPFITVKKHNRYYVFKHPLAHLYGFIVK
jgi:hypothetical protein